MERKHFFSSGGDSGFLNTGMISRVYDITLVGKFQILSSSNKKISAKSQANLRVKFETNHRITISLLK